MCVREASRIASLLIAVIVLIGTPVSPAVGQDGWTDAGTVVHLTTGSDRVGIGTVTPQRKLHVSGGARVTGILEVGQLRPIGSAPLVLRLGSQSVLRLEPTTMTPNLIGGDPSNDVQTGVHAATISGGGLDDPGWANVVNDHFGTIGGGAGNQTGTIDVDPSDAQGATVGGGFFNAARGQASTVAGGDHNAATGSHGTIPGGFENQAASHHTFAAGFRARAQHAGSFVWSDFTFVAGDPWFPSTALNQFRIRSTGGAEFVSAINTTTGVPTAGVTLPSGGNSWASISDRGLKANVSAVDGRDILRRLSAVPITQWNLKAQDPAIKHLGPMAQDFYAAFELGEDERYIGTGDAQGVALVSIQALYGMVLALERKAELLDRLAQRLAELEARVGGAAASR